MRPAIPITVLGGYLGAGKTTLLNDVLAHAGGRRIAVIVNDFGELGIDAALVGPGATDGVVDLPNGCICCTLGADLGVALAALAERRDPPDHIVIEASGVSDPRVLAAWGTVPGFAPGGTIVLAAADTVRRQAADRYVGDEVLRQLRAGDLVVVTKSDLVSPEQLLAVRSWLGERTSSPVVPPPDPPSELVLLAPGRHPEPAQPPTGPTHDERYLRWGWRPSPDRRPSPEALAAFVDALPPTVLRAKGVVPTSDDGTFEVQVVGANRAVTSCAAADGTAGIVAIGVGGRLDPGELDTLAATHLT